MSESKANAAIRKELAEKEKKVADEIQAVLEANGMALQLFIQYSEYGMIPRVRLVANEPITTPNETPDDTGTDSEEAGTDTVEDGAATDSKS